MTGRVKAVLAVVLVVGSAGVSLRAIPQGAPPKHAEVPEDQRVDINRASVDELLKVPGMTRTWAGRIVRFRPYRSKNELLDRGVVNSEVYNRIKDYIVAHRKDSGQ